MEKGYIEVRTHENLSGGYVLETVANFKEVYKGYNDKDQQIDFYVSCGYYVIPFVGGVIGWVVSPLIYSIAVAAAPAMLAGVGISLIFPAASALAVAVLAEGALYIGHQSYQLFRHNSNEAHDYIAAQHGGISKAFYCQAGWGGPSFSYFYEGRHVVMQFTCKKNDLPNIDALLRSACNEVKRMSKVQEYFKYDKIEMQLPYDAHFQQVHHKNNAYSCKIKTDEKEWGIDGRGSSTKLLKECHDEYFKGDKCKDHPVLEGIPTNPLGSPIYDQKDGKVTIIQTIRVPEKFQTDGRKFFENGFVCSKIGLELEGALHQCMKESYHLPYRWESKFTTENVDGNYLFYPNSVCLIPGDAAILRYTLKLEHPNRVKEIGEGVCEGYKIIISARDGGCGNHAQKCSKDGLGQEAEPFAENNCGFPGFTHKGHEYVYDCFKHEFILDKPVGGCLAFWDCAGGEL